jgi:ribosomal protein S18 acetylase RimI-like enzyme
MSAISITDIPSIEGLFFRSITGEEDAHALHAVHTGRITRDKVDRLLHHEDLPSLDRLRRDLSEAVAEGEQDQWLVAQIHERVVGYSQLESWHEEDPVWVYLIEGWVLPQWRGKGIGTAMLHWGEKMARQGAAAEHPNERFEFAANASCTEQDATALLLNEGYYVGFTSLEMQFDMATTLPETPPLPEGLEVRPVLPEHYPLIVSSIIECYHNAFPGGRFRGTFDRVAHYSAEFQKPKYDPNLWYVAWDGNEVAGQVLLVIEYDQVYVREVSVRPAWRRKGLARTLMIRALRDMRERGEKVIWTDTFAEYQTRAVDLYLSLGFAVAKEFPRYRKLAS